MNLESLAKNISDTSPVPLSKKDTMELLEYIFETISNVISSGEPVKIKSFGAFYTKQREATQKTNPRNPEELMQIPSKMVPKFRAYKGLKETVEL